MVFRVVTRIITVIIGVVRALCANCARAVRALCENAAYDAEQHSTVGRCVLTMGPVSLPWLLCLQDRWADTLLDHYGLVSAYVS